MAQQYIQQNLCYVVVLKYIKGALAAFDCFACVKYTTVKIFLKSVQRILKTLGLVGHFQTFGKISNKLHKDPILKSSQSF